MNNRASRRDVLYDVAYVRRAAALGMGFALFTSVRRVLLTRACARSSGIGLLFRFLRWNVRQVCLCRCCGEHVIRRWAGSGLRSIYDVDCVILEFLWGFIKYFS